MIPMTARMVTMDEAFGGLGNLQQELQRLLGNTEEQATAVPSVNVWSSQEKTVVTAELPGVDPEAINISVVGQELTIAGERQRVQPGNGEVYHRQECHGGPFSRRIGLPYAVATDQVCAKYSRGLLEVSLPRHEATKPRRIAVSSG